MDSEMTRLGGFFNQHRTHEYAHLACLRRRGFIGGSFVLEAVAAGGMVR
jgi:hypothetical protein